MPIRGTRNASEIFKAVLADARREILLGGDRAAAFQHRGIKGDERAAALGQFLRERLPSRFGVGKGEVIDCRDHRSGQLDVIVYDKASCAPISVQAENVLLPCEALYVVVEVKSILTATELKKSFKAARAIRQLRPFKSHFVGPRASGEAADDGAHRCMYLIVAYTSDLANKTDWAQKEFSRAATSAATETAPLDTVDRIVVLDRGMINPGAGKGIWDEFRPESFFLNAYLHIVNFVTRESKRRPPVDWQMYGSRKQKGWKQLKAV
jgi:hypothetical protein